VSTDAEVLNQSNRSGGLIGRQPTAASGHPIIYLERVRCLQDLYTLKTIGGDSKE
jgi:hypothetical protein